MRPRNTVLACLHLGVTDTNATKEIWEDVIREFPKMFTQETYEGYEGKYWSLPPRKILPRPYGKAHPAMWYAAGNPPSYEMAGRMGLGVLGFSLDSLDKVEKLRSAYKGGIANAEPVGAFVNDNIMSCIAAYVAEDSTPANPGTYAIVRDMKSGRIVVRGPGGGGCDCDEDFNHARWFPPDSCSSPATRCRWCGARASTSILGTTRWRRCTCMAPRSLPQRTSSMA